MTQAITWMLENANAHRFYYGVSDDPQPHDQNATVSMQTKQHRLQLWQLEMQRNSIDNLLPIEQAIQHGFMADGVGFAFTAGYQMAIRRLLGPALIEQYQITPANFGALCVTEAGGNSPKHIATTLNDMIEIHQGARLNGEKSFVTGAEQADLLLIAVTSNKTKNSAQTPPENRPEIKVALVESNTPGITVTALPELPFIPEISHGTVNLKQVDITYTQILPGDGYTDYIKPFRTIEDIHVFGALLGYLFKLSQQFKLSKPLGEVLLANLNNLIDLCSKPALDIETHLCLAGVIHQANQAVNFFETDCDTIKNIDAQGSIAAILARWHRDKPLLSIASSARTARTKKAWQLVAN